MWVWFFIFSALVIMLIIAVLNHLTFPRLTERLEAGKALVSLLVPARNEADRIEATVTRLLAQTHTNLEVIVLDDNSSDGTGAAAECAAAGDDRFRLISGGEPPAGWLGKNWACHQLAQMARGEVLVFTDADVLWEPRALAGVVHMLERREAGMLTVWPTQRFGSIPERLVVPLMMFAVLAYLPEWLVRKTTSPWFAAANGQVLVFRRETYEEVGGHRAVRSAIVEDVKLARQAKRRGIKLVMALGTGAISTRMYSGWQAVRDGFGKNILAGYGGSPFLLALAAIFHLLVFVFPWAIIASALVSSIQQGMLYAAASAALLGMMVRALTARTSGGPVVDAIWMPVSVLMMTAVAIRSFTWHFSPGGPQWKGRSLRTQRSESSE